MTHPDHVWRVTYDRLDGSLGDYLFRTEAGARAFARDVNGSPVVQCAQLGPWKDAG